MSYSILEGIRRGCNVDQESDDFDEELIPIANSVFSELTELKVGPEEGFTIGSTMEVWEDYCTDKVLLGFVKQFVYKSVRLSFDPPASSTILEAMKNEILKLEWKIIDHLERQNE